VNGWTFVERVFGYTGFVRAWGIPLVAHVVKATTGIDVPLGWLTYALVVTLMALWIVMRRMRVEQLPALITTTFLIVLFLAPGFGVQYLYWPLPFVAFALPKQAAFAFHAVVSAYLFAIYTAWSGGWPWWFAEKANDPRVATALSQSGVVLWLLLGVAAVVALRRQSLSRP
jgi:hypothetical protein